MSAGKLQKLRISLKAYEPSLLDNSCNKIVDAVKASGIDAIGPIPLPTKQRFPAPQKSPASQTFLLQCVFSMIPCTVGFLIHGWHAQDYLLS